jgi:hypothetical protein
MTLFWLFPANVPPLRESRLKAGRSLSLFDFLA